MEVEFVTANTIQQDKGPHFKIFSNLKWFMPPSVDSYNIKRRIFITICNTMQLSGNLAWQIPVVEDTQP